ncbi:MAG: hypothetical protein AB1489_37105 [Acidobacteriota bacterium]
MIIEFQIKPDAFLTAFRNRLKLIPACLPDTFNLGLGSCLGESMLDHIRVTPDTSLENAGDGVIKLQQPIELFFVTVAGLESQGAKPTPACFSFVVTLVFNLMLQLDNGKTSMCINFDEIQAPGVPADLLQQVEAILAGNLVNQCTPLDLAPIFKLIGGAPSIARAGMSFKESPERIAMRLAINSAGSEQSWNNFFSGNIVANPQGNDWTLFLDQELLNGSINDRFLLSLQEPIDNNKFSLDSGPSTQYVPMGGIPMFQVSLTGEAIDACVCLWDAIDIDVDVFADITLSVPEINIIQMKLSVDWDLNDAEVICCAFTAGIFWGFIGTNLLQEGQIGWGEFLAGVFTGLPGVFSAAIFSAHDQAGEQIQFPAEWEKLNEDGTEYRLKQTVKLGNKALGEMALTTVHGHSNGPILGGTLSSVIELKDPELDLFVDFADFSWSVDDKCAADPIPQVSSEITFRNAGFNVVGQVPIFACEVELVEGSDPVNQFGPFLKWDNDGVDITIKHTQIKAAYKANPYPCQLRIITNGGVRIYTIPPIKILSAAEIEEIINKVKLGQVVNCHEYQAGHPFWKGSRYNPKWGPRPPEFEKYLQLWDIVITGLSASEIVKVDETNGKQLATVTANNNGVAYISATIPVQQTDTSIGLSLTRQQPRATSIGEKSLTIKQVSAVHTEQFLTSGEVLSFSAGKFQGGPALALTTPQGIYVYDMRMPGFARLVDFQVATQFSGIAPLQDGFLAWGTAGLKVIGTKSAITHTTPVNDIAFRRQQLYVLTPEQVLKFDRDGRISGALRVGRGQNIAVGGDILTLVSDGQLQLFQADSFAALGIHEIRSVQSILTRARINGGCTFYLKQATGGVTLSISNRGVVTETARFIESPWFEDAIRVGKLIVKLTSDRHAIDVYSLAKSATLRR